MKLEKYLEVIEQFLQTYLEDSHMEKYVLGLSGGVDSSLTAALIRHALPKEKLICVMIPINSHPSDLTDAIKVANELDVNYVVIDGKEMFEAGVNTLKVQGIKLDKAALSNLKVRIRMSILYAIAQKEKALVVGTDNMDERYTGYFTKWGDGACDLLPICHLTKGEVIEAAKIKGVSSALAERVPSAGLFEGQTDESEMGVTYADLDKFLLGGKVAPQVEERILHLHKVSEHKRNPIPCPKDFTRDEQR